MQVTASPRLLGQAGSTGLRQKMLVEFFAKAHECHLHGVSALGKARSMCTYPRTRLLQDVEERAPTTQKSLTVIAAQDRLFLQQQAFDLRAKAVRDTSHILDTITLLIERLQYAHVEKGWNDDELEPLDRIAFEKYLANLDHLLRCLQQAALEALIYHSSRHLQHDYKVYEQLLEQQRKVDSDCRTEWVGGQPPLNSTMPWNIKPSLVVLWGVCWMFYVNANGQRVSPEGSRLRRESASTWPPQTWSQTYDCKL